MSAFDTFSVSPGCRPLGESTVFLFSAKLAVVIYHCHMFRVLEAQAGGSQGREETWAN